MEKPNSITAADLRVCFRLTNHAPQSNESPCPGRCCWRCFPDVLGQIGDHSYRPAVRPILRQLLDAGTIKNVGRAGWRLKIRLPAYCLSTPFAPAHLKERDPTQFVVSVWIGVSSPMFQFLDGLAVGKLRGESWIVSTDHVNFKCAPVLCPPSFQGLLDL